MKQGVQSSKESPKCEGRAAYTTRPSTSFASSSRTQWESLSMGKRRKRYQSYASLISHADPDRSCSACSTLIKYHFELYAANKKRRTDSIKRGFCRETPDGRLQLTLEHKRDILLNNVYGVDLDAQAVEVAQLPLNLKLLEPLNLKLLEEENAVQPKLGGFREQLLPNLNKNIVHGNSLIDRHNGRPALRFPRLEEVKPR